MSDSPQMETYYQRNRERLLAYAKEYGAKHREQQRQYWKTYYIENKEALNEKERERREKKKAQRPPKVKKEKPVKEPRVVESLTKPEPVVKTFVYTLADFEVRFD